MNGAGDERRRTRAAWGVLLAIVAVAALVRLPALTAGLPYTSYIDEFALVDGSTHQIVEGTWNPGRHDYPTFLMTATTLVGGALTLLSGTDLAEGARVSQSTPYIYVLEPPELILGGRAVVMALSVATVLGIGLLGRELVRWRVGLVAAGVAAVLPAFVTRGSILITDTPAAAFTTLVLLAAAKIANGRSVLRWGLVAGAGAGLAFGSKYTGMAALVIPLVVLAWRTDLAWAARAKAGAAVVGAAAGAAILAVPAVVLDPGAVRDGIDFLRGIYAFFAPTDPLHEQAVRHSELGPFMPLLALAGLVVLLVRRRSRPVAVGYLAAAVPTLAVLLDSGFQPFRNALPLVPMACVTAAVAIDAAVGVVARRLDGRIPAVAPTVAVLGVGCVLAASLLGTGTRHFVADQRHYVDTRVEARRWLQDNVEPDDRVLVAEELGFLPRELALIDAEVVVAPQQGFDVEGEWDLVVSGVIHERPYAWAEELMDRAEIATFGWLEASCPRGLRGTPEGPLCPQGPVPRAWHWNNIGVHVHGPVTAG